MIKILTLGVISASMLFANTNSMILYDNIALIDEYKDTVSLVKGMNDFKYTNVSPNIVVDSVLISLPEKARVIEQNYNSNEFNFKILAENNINKTVIFKDVFDKKKEGKLISIVGNKGLIKYVEMDNLNKEQVALVDLNNIVTAYTNESDPQKPSLSFNIYSEKNYDKVNLNLKYLSSGLSWQSNYIANIKDDNLELSGLITLNNLNNISFNNYKLKVVAGDVNSNQARPMTKNYMRKNVDMELSSMAMSDNMEAVSHGGYQVYDIPFNVNIDANSMKQIGFMKKTIKEWDKINSINVGFISSAKNQHFNQSIRFKNNEDVLGAPLPKGNIRFYSKNNKDNTNYFLGENYIGNTAVNEIVDIIIGNDFDSFINYESNCTSYTGGKYNKCTLYSLEYNIHNSSNEDKKYEINQNIGIQNKNSVLNMKPETNCKDECSFDLSANSLKTFITVKANSEVNINFKLTND